MATDIPSHNINEIIDATVFLLDNPRSELGDLLEIIKGPDFSNNASIIASEEELLEIYSTGRGGFKIQAQWAQEKNDIIINALPYQASGSKILEQIADQMLKKKIPMVVDLADEGDHEEPVRLVITLKSNRVNAEDVMNHLFASTDLQKNYRANMNLISLAGGPKVFDLLSLLKEWITFRKNTVIRRLEHRLDQVNDRLHILEGLLAVYLNIDEVIKIIRESDEPKKEIIREFKLTDIQANAILEIRLRQLAKLEQIKLEDERSKLSDEQKEIETILSSKARLKTLIKKELLEIKENFGEERRSPIKSASNAKVFSEEETLVTEPITVVLSEAGWIRSGKGHEIDPSSLSYRGEDKLQDYARGKSNQTAVFIDSSGKVFSIPSHSLPSARGMGEPISGRVNAESGVNFISALIGEPDDKFIFTNTAGYGYISEFSNTISNKKTGKAFMKIPEGASLIKSQKLREDHQYIAAVSNIGKLLIFRLDELPMLPKGKGNKIINIPTAKFKSKEEKMLDIQLLAEDSNLVVHYGTKTRSLPFKDWQHYISSRAKRGNILAGHLKRVESISEEVKVKDSAKESS
jgi:topoisomerase-4 subunit A